MNAQVEQALAELEAELPETITPQIAMEAIRAAYARGYMAALGSDEE